MPHIHWKAARKTITKKLRRIVARPAHYAPPPIRMKPNRPLDRLTVEMWKDYRAFKAAGMLAAWRRKWAAYLPHQF